MSEIHYRTCPLCEAMCGVAIEWENDTVLSVTGDKDDPFSRGYICPKAVSLKELHHDPDRLRKPIMRDGAGWKYVSWKDAVNVVVERIATIQKAHGDDSVALYLGNPTTHSYSAVLASLELSRALATRNLFSTASVDHLPHIFAAYQMFGHKAMVPVPDLDRTDFLLVFGANPVVSNGSMMSAPNINQRLKRLKARGGRLVVVDPQRTQTARMADTHLFIAPSTDVLLLLALVHALFDEDLVHPGRLADFSDGIETVRESVREFAPDRVAPIVKIDAAVIRQLAKDFANSPSAVCYGRLGVCTQPFGALCCWLIAVLNVLTGNLDRPGGAMFTTPAVDLVGLASALGEKGSFDRWRSRVRGLPEFSGELPLSVLAEEIGTPGPGQIRGMITFAGNPVLSAPNGSRLEKVLPSLDFMVSIDLYMNETTRHAKVILPTTFALEREHYDLLLNALAVRNVARYCPPLFKRGPDALHDWEILLELARRIAMKKGRASSWPAVLRSSLLKWWTPSRFLNLCMLFGPYGSVRNPSKKALSVKSLARMSHTLDLGELKAGQLPRRLYTKHKTVVLAPDALLQNIRTVSRHFLENGQRNREQLVLIGRRQVRNNNSWMHNCSSLVSGPDRCTLLMNDDDAAERGLHTGQLVRVRSRVASITAPLEVTDAIMQGVVSLPHGFGHNRDETRLRVANVHPGVSVNDITDDTLVDELTGTSCLNGVPVCVESTEMQD